MFRTINEHIFNSYVQKENERGLKSVDIFYPSQASCVDLVTEEVHGTCARAIYYKNSGIYMTNPPSSANIRKMMYGNKIEEAEIEYIKQMNICVDSQIPFEKIKDTIKIRGRVDAIIKKDNTFIGLEYKSGGGYGFRSSIFGTAKKQGFPKIANLMQAMLYIDQFKDDTKYPFTECWLMYIDREQCLTHSVKITLNERGFPLIDDEVYQNININGIYERYKYLFKHLTLGILPKRDFSPEIPMSEIERRHSNNEISENAYKVCKKDGKGQDAMCSFCNYKTRCLQDK